ncbi:hypothetical protein TSOC_003376 [Tetrabaena socialis]|uniref:ShKT domain-containing protein n=1 Tax=Tetrabaena socialis TaxID=47790 RepID=A0A2J8ABS9_9CHLO|nr:hypothetical protein TSOC_003376 [Tetrabaena socialis]|eukprot:PNH09966.1 hypothetical protein TSOC_003376 [Tetrabaena socialis]
MPAPLLLVLALSGAWGVASLADAGEREEAFIGYSERALECKDRLADCRGKSKHDGCLKDPYNLRTFCPISCNVQRCLSSGTLKVRHKGFASPLDTATYAQRWVQSSGASEASKHFKQREFAGKPLKLSSLGVGTYLGEPDSRTDEAVAAALIYSVANGFNVIDTASSYRWGHAESSVGAALDALLAGVSVGDFAQDGETSTDLTRSMLFISTKAGFVDEALVRQLTKAFTELETLRAAGSIRHYGLATWDCFRLPPGNPGHLDLQDVVAIAAEAAAAVSSGGAASGGQRSGFAAIQLPVSAEMSEAWREPWQALRNGTATLMAAAEALGVAVFTSGPLGEGGLLGRLTSRLDDVVQLRAQATTAQKLLQLARSTPGGAMASALVGHKTREFVVANCELAKADPLQEVDFRRAMATVSNILAGPQGGGVAAT